MVDGAIPGMPQNANLLWSIKWILEQLDEVQWVDGFVWSTNQDRDPYKMACTAINAISPICSMFNYPMSDEILSDFWSYCKVKYGYKQNVGNDAWRWMEAAVTRWNKWNSSQVKDYRTKMLSNEFWTALKKWYWCQFCYYWNADYNNDKNDGLLNASNFWQHTYAHCTVLYYRDENSVTVVDSYKWMRGAKYNISNKTLQDLVANWVFVSDCCFPLPSIKITNLVVKKARLDWHLYRIRKAKNAKL